MRCVELMGADGEFSDSSIKRSLLMLLPWELKDIINRKFIDSDHTCSMVIEEIRGRISFPY